MFSNHHSSDRSGWGNRPLVSSLACLLKVAATPPSSSLSLSTDFFRAKQGQPSMCLLVTPLGDPDSQRKVGGSREAAGVMVGRLSPSLHPLFPLWSGFLLLHSQQSLRVPCHMYPLEKIYNLLTSWGPIFFLTPGTRNDKTLPRSLLSELNYVFALRFFISGLLIYFLSLEGTLTKQR